MIKTGSIWVLIYWIADIALSFGQITIWQEDFDYSDGTTIGENKNEANPSADWTSSGCMACVDTADWWEIRSKAMEARDVNQVTYLQTEMIDISGFDNVRFSLDVSEIGDHEGLYFGLDACADQDKEDYVNVLYRIDHGPWNLVSNYLDWCGLYNSCGSHTLYGDDGINSGDCRDNDDDWGLASININLGPLSGNSLEIRIEIINSATDEKIRIDNLLVQGDLLLPVILTSFRLMEDDERVQIEWHTARERNSDYFVLERAIGGPEDWQEVARISALGFKNTSSKYQFEDFPPHSGRWFYRLKQVDFDGWYQYSAINSILVDRPFNLPNPVRDLVRLPLTNGGFNRPSIQLFHIQGGEIPLNYRIFEKYIELNISNLSTGYYIVTLDKKSYEILVDR